MRLIGVPFLFGLGACHAGSTAVPDTPAGPGGDDAQHGLGMFVSWNADPALPGPLNDKLTVSEVTFQIDHFQIVADAGSVTRSHYQLAWDGMTTPKQDTFPDAPPGVYSKITLSMMNSSFGGDTFLIRGTWRDNGGPRPFEIHDRNPLSLSFDCDETLSAAGSTTIAIRVDLEDALEGVNFKNLDVDNGVLELHDGPELMNFRGRLQRAFDLDR
jgi:hypothetical protein